MPAKIKSRKPTGVAPWPFILLAGEEKSGKSLAAAMLSTSDKLGATYWLDLGEGAGDEYGALRGANYEVIEHDGTYREILEQVAAVHAAAVEAAGKGEPPIVLVIDSLSALWSMLVDWTNDRARRSKTGQRKLAADSDAEIDPTMNLWNDANGRWFAILDLLRTFPGIAVGIARDKLVSEVDKDGQPIAGTKTWKVEGQKGLQYDATATIRTYRDSYEAELVAVRSLNVQMTAGKPLPLPKVKHGGLELVSIERLVFDMLGCVIGASKARDFQALAGDAASRWLAAVDAAADEEALKAVYEQTKAERALTPQHRQSITEAVKARLGQLRSPQQEDEQAAALAEAAGSTETHGTAKLDGLVGDALDSLHDASTTLDAVLELAAEKGYSPAEVAEVADLMHGTTELDKLVGDALDALHAEFTAKRKRPARKAAAEKAETAVAAA